MNKRKIKLLLTLVVIVTIAFSMWKEVSTIDFSPNYYILPYQKALLGSQYTGGSGLIPDETAYQYAAGHHIRGGRIQEVNPEVPPLGKYLLGFSILLFNNTSHIIIICAVLSLIALYHLSKLVIHDSFVSLIPVLLLSTEQLFLDQLIIRPLLDIIQLPFIILAFYYFIKAQEQYRKELFIIAGLMLGFVASIKVMITAILIVLTWLMYLVVIRNKSSIISLFIYCVPLVLLVLVVSYTKLFVEGHSLWYFLLVQKWVLLYQQSKILYPFSVWRLIFFNQWQTWWGDFNLLQTKDWTLVWPISIIITVWYGLLGLLRKTRMEKSELVLFSWVVIYLAFLSLGTISTRHLLPILPFLYFLSIKMLTSKIAK